MCCEIHGNQALTEVFASCPQKHLLKCCNQLQARHLIMPSIAAVGLVATDCMEEVTFPRQYCQGKS